MFFSRFMWALLLGLACAGCRKQDAAPQTAGIDFNRDIRPILSENCFACHGPDTENNKAGLRLDTFEHATAVHSNKGRAIVPGKPEDSLAVRKILDRERPMPPRETGKSVSTQQLAVLRAWISSGAKFEPHWAFRPLPASVNVPAVGQAAWCRDDIDRFVLARLEQEKIEPSREAPKWRWLRRVTYDLTGMPPTPAELDAFDKDSSPEARERVVDRLLASPRFGEHMAVFWLDAARYADSYGYQADWLATVWPWRDWVIGAINTNMPYDRFITEQLAGDLLPAATREQKLATAFNRLHRMTNEGGSIPEEFRIEGVADRVRTVGTSVMGLTLECARCHTHKYDPILHKEYFAFSAFFNSIDEAGIYSFFTKATPTPALNLPTPEQELKLASTRAALDEAEAAYVKHLTSKGGGGMAHGSLQPVAHFPLDDWPAGKAPNLVTPAKPGNVAGSVAKTAGRIGGAAKFDGDDGITFPGVADFERWDAFSLGLWVNIPTNAKRAVILHKSKAWLDACGQGFELTYEDGRLFWGLIHFWPGDAVAIDTELPAGRWVHIAATYDGSSRASGLHLYLDGKPAQQRVLRDRLTRQIGGGWDLALASRFRDRGLADGAIDDVKVFDRALVPDEVSRLFNPSVATAPAVDDPEGTRLRGVLREARKSYGSLIDAVPQIMAMEEMDQARETHLLKRGQYDMPADVVKRGTFAALPAFPSNAPVNRLGLAQWLTHPDHPLTARVAANRWWMLMFGRGLVGTPDNFGLQGESPTHPELLDFLARRLVAEKWDMKRFFRHVALSATYSQDSTLRPDLRERDPENRWLARGPAVRLSAEQIRDTALAASGLLSAKMGGPPVRPYQPGDLWKENNSFSPSYDQGKGEDLYRRSLYTVWKRTAPSPNMMNFDATTREFCTVKRPVTSTPLQALGLLNDVQFIEAARVLAQELLAANGTEADRLREATVRFCGRGPTEAEAAVLQKALAEQRASFKAQQGDAAKLLKLGERPAPATADAVELAAWTVVVQTIMNQDACVWKR